MIEIDNESVVGFALDIDFSRQSLQLSDDCTQCEWFIISIYLFYLSTLLVVKSCRTVEPRTRQAHDLLARKPMEVPQGASKDDGEEAQDTNDDTLTHRGRHLVVTFSVPNTSGPGKRLVPALDELLVSNGVEDEADESEGVAQDLEDGDLCLPDEDGGGDEEDALEDATESHDEARSLADLVRELAASVEQRGYLDLPGKR